MLESFEKLLISVTTSLLMPSGTNINEALLKAINMLLKATNQGLIDPRSVSMIILVSDGDPTVGKPDLPSRHTELLHLLCSVCSDFCKCVDVLCEMLSCFLNYCCAL